MSASAGAAPWPAASCARCHTQLTSTWASCCSMQSSHADAYHRVLPYSTARTTLHDRRDSSIVLLSPSLLEGQRHLPGCAGHECRRVHGLVMYERVLPFLRCLACAVGGSDGTPKLQHASSSMEASSLNSAGDIMPSALHLAQRAVCRVAAVAAQRARCVVRTDRAVIHGLAGALHCACHADTAQTGVVRSERNALRCRGELAVDVMLTRHDRSRLVSVSAQVLRPRSHNAQLLRCNHAMSCSYIPQLTPS